MPSAANAKLEKQASMEAVENTPIRQAIVVIEHKIRNLEKRKGKLESYQNLQKSGKELNNDQKEAVAKYNEVIQTLEFARELVKQFVGISALAEKDAKKLSRKEALQRVQQDIVKIREVLTIQDTLAQLGDETVRSDFLAGTNGAIQLTDQDLKILDDLYPEVTPKHDGEGFVVNAHRSADHLNAVVDGKPKEAFNTTYGHIKEIIGSVQGSGYFKQVPEPESEEQIIEVIESLIINEEQQEQVSVDEAVPLAVPIEEQPVNTEAPAPTAVPAPAFPPPQTHQVPQTQQPQQVNFTPQQQGLPSGPIPQVIPPQVPAVVPVVAAPLPPNAAMPPLATVQAVEHAYFAQQFLQQQRPIAEVIGGGNFYFLQDSELDSPDVIPANVQQNPPRASQSPPPAQNAPIPTQTFTNQNFASVTNVPIPTQPQLFTHPVPVPVPVNKVPEISQPHIPGFANPINPPPPIPMPPGHVVQQNPGTIPVQGQQAPSQGQPQQPQIQQPTQPQVTAQPHAPFSNQQQSQGQQPPQQQTMASAVASGKITQKPQFPIQSQQPPSVKPFPQQNQNVVPSQSPVTATAVPAEMKKEETPASTGVVQESSDWAEDTTSDWNMATTENNQTNEWASETQDAWVGQGQGDGYNTRGGYNSRGRGRGRGNTNNSYRARNNYQQNGRPASGTYYRNNDQGGSNNYYQNQNGNSGGSGYQGGNRENSGYQGGNRESGGYQSGNRDGSGYQSNFKSRGNGNRGNYRGNNQDRGVPRSNNRGAGLVGQGGGNSRPQRGGGGGTGGQYVRRESKPQQ